MTRLSFDTAEMIARHPLSFQHAKKKRLFELIMPKTHRGTIEVSRWTVMDLPDQCDPTVTEIEARADVFDYADPSHWYLNFAHHQLFAFYGGPLFAQDEIQVAEHPALGSLREALLQSVLVPLTVEDGSPTPILIRGVERCAAIDTSRIYGQQFARASEEAIAKSVRRLQPPTTSNILAMEAPDGGRGRYTSMQIGYILETAFTGFAAVEKETPRSTIHTGFWGCGAYGGNRILMSMLQIIAARMARIAKLVFHAVSPSGLETFERARKELGEIAPRSTGTSKLISALTAKGFEWGVSDGN